MQKIASNYLSGFIIPLGRSIRTDLAGAMKILTDVATRNPRVLREPEPTAQVLQLADNGVDLELGFWIEDPEKGSSNVRSDISVELLAEFRARDIEIPYPQRAVSLLQRSNAASSGNSAAP